MKFLEKLKYLIKIHVKDISILNNFTLININKSSNIKDNSMKITKEDKYFIDDENKTLIIFIDRLNSSEKKILKEIVKDHTDEGNLFFENKSLDLFERICDYRKKNPDKAILRFFKDIIPSMDYDALESSLFLKEALHNKYETSNLKEGIVRKFGDRGRNIANLTSGGYFHEFLKPLYNVEQENKFKELYEIIIETFPIAIFVHSGSKKENIIEEIQKKVLLCKKYRFDFIHVHGIGEQNIKIIKEVLSDIENIDGVVTKKIYDENNIIIAELIPNI